MSKKRYHYDAKGKLKGFSTDKPIVGPKFYFVTLPIVILVMAFFKDDDDRPQPTSEEAPKVEQVAPAHQPSSPDKSDPSQVGEAYISANPVDPDLPVSTMSDFDRDLRPGYEKDCAAGDASACQVLANEDRRTGVSDNQMINPMVQD